MNYLGGVVLKEEVREGGFWGTCLVKDVYSGYCSGWPLRLKETNMASMFRCTSSAAL
jgi:hypothetical protein